MMIEENNNGLLCSDCSNGMTVTYGYLCQWQRLVSVCCPSLFSIGVLAENKKVSLANRRQNQIQSYG